MSNNLSNALAVEFAEDTSFALTDMQQAYWLGEQELYRLHTPAMLYRCYFTKSCDLDKLSAALLKLAHRHPSFYTFVNDDGTQKIGCPPAEIPLSITDLRSFSPVEKNQWLASRRERLEDQLPPMGTDPVHFSCYVDRDNDGDYIHFLLRLIAFDGRSIMIFFSELATLLSGAELEGTPKCLFKDFVHLQQDYRRTDKYKQSLQYWTARVNDLPSGPELPLAHHDKIPNQSRFHRHRIHLPAADLAQLNQQAKKCGVTINALLCTVYADVLKLWSRNKNFTLNLLISQRPFGNKDYEGVIGNFSSTLLLEINSESMAFQERARETQKQLYRDIAHASVSGVEVIRAMRRKSESTPAMPIVFASTLGLDISKEVLTPDAIGWQLIDDGLRTPQVWLDHQVYMEGDKLVLNMDFADGIFAEDFADAFFTVYQQYLARIQQANFEEQNVLYPRVPDSFLSVRQKANQTEKILPKGLLHDFFASCVTEFTNKTAIITQERHLQYDELFCYTTHLAQKLQQQNVGPNQLVAVVARRGWRQVAALMSIVQAGGAYLPIASDLPAARIEYLMSRPGVKAILVERELLDLGFVPPNGVPLLILEDELPDEVPAAPVKLASSVTENDLAYVIFTSGSTGQPKGVAIDHRGAVNTIQDVIERFGVCADDKFIGISAYNFDLSVFDIFGTLGLGATLVLPPHSERPAPETWAKMVKEHQVTLWNTVPALLEMQIEYCAESAKENLNSLKLVMLSGDWIPISLPDRVKKIIPDCQFVSLGGATEASIWSNYFIVEQTDPNWDSIPYGWPLSNQSFHALDHNLQPVPDWVPGNLFIGGVGLAREYYMDAQRTADSFIFHPETGERLYRTGDVGRYHASGFLEFLGRNDNQVKIRGFRIELGEIEAALERCQGVRSGAAVVRPVGERDKQLIAFYVAKDSSIPESQVRAHLTSVLPDYMVPSVIAILDEMPVTANGKVDRKALLTLATDLAVNDKILIEPRNETELKLRTVWRNLLGINDISVDDSFFEIGGTSLIAVRLLNAIKESFHCQLPLASLLREDSIAKQAVLITSQINTTTNDTPEERKAVVVINEGTEGTAIFVHPVGGNLLCYRHLAELLPKNISIVGIQSPGDGRARKINELAESYVNELRQTIRTEKPILLFGWSLGGVVAQEMAGIFEVMGIKPKRVIMIDSWMGSKQSKVSDRLEGVTLIKNFVTDFLNGAPLPIELTELDGQIPVGDQIEKTLSILRHTTPVVGNLSRSEFENLMLEHQANFNALIQHKPQACATPIVRARGLKTKPFPYLEPFDVDGIEADQNVTIDFDENHFSIFTPPVLKKIISFVFDQTAIESTTKTLLV